MSYNIIIYGKGNFAKLMYYYLENDSKYKVMAFCIDKEYLDSSTFCNLPVVSFSDISTLYSPLNYKVLVAIGYSNMRARKHMFEKIKNKKYKCINYISTKAIVDKSVSLGENNIILENTVVEPFSKIGDNNIIWSSSNICHNTTVYSHSFIAAQVLIGGFSTIKDNVFIGFNSTIIQNIILAEETLVGAKSLMLKSSNNHTKYIGSPAKEVSSHVIEGIKIK